MTELKPCPFCGGKATLWKEDVVWADIVWVGCEVCGVLISKHIENHDIKT